RVLHWRLPCLRAGRRKRLGQAGNHGRNPGPGPSFEGRLTMKIVRFEQGGKVLLGQLSEDRIGSVADDGMQAFIENWDTHAARNALDRALPGAGLALDEVSVLAPVVPVRNVLCVGWNYLKHFNESIGKREGQEVELPEVPT